MSSHLAQTVLLALTVLICWVGVLGAWRMRQPTQMLHYLTLPAVASFLLTAAVFLATGNSQAGWKTLLIACILLGFNSVVTHATARAFRARELGHWEPRDGDPIEWVRDTGDAAEPSADAKASS